MSLLRKIHSTQDFLNKHNVFLYIYYLSIAAVLIGFIYSRALLSIGQIALAVNFLIEGDYSKKIKRIRNNKLSWLLFGFYLLHVIGLFYTSDFEYAAEDLRIKLPLLLFPVVFAGTDILSKRTLKYTLYLFVTVIFSSSIVISINYFLHNSEITDIREASFLISHIRLALMICLCISICVYYTTKEGLWISFSLIAVSLWFTIFMIYFVYITGIAILSILGLFMIFWYLRRSNLIPVVKMAALSVMMLISISVTLYIYAVSMDYYKSNQIKHVEDLNFTFNGKPYSQWYKKFDYSIRENGYLVYQNVCFDELQKEWNKRSAMHLMYLDDNYSDLEDVLLRFLASKGLPKDSVGLSSLDDSELSAIERGITNVNYMGKSRFYARIYNLFWQYDVYTSGGNFNGHSLGIRMEFWKTGLNVFKRHFWFGTGTGDIEKEFQLQYEIDKSNLQKEWRFRSHNQFISVAGTFGLVGLMYFAFVLIAPFRVMKTNFLYLSFAIIFILSILTEDTLETQIGVTFYAFFNSLLIFQLRPLKTDSNT